MSSAPEHARAAALRGAQLTLFGAVTSGPLGFAVVAATHPQPAWQNTELFVRSFHPVQVIPFYFGFSLIGGFVLLIAALHAMAPPALRVRTTCALIFTAAFAALISLNYIVQTTFVPSLVGHYTPARADAIASFSMSCPSSLAWGLEMWGYGVLGVATWLVAPVLRETALERWTARLLVANGVVSIAGALGTGLYPGWVLTTAGFAAFAGWNALVIALGILGWRALATHEHAAGHAIA